MNPPTSQAAYLDIAIGALIEARRRKKKLTQAKLAAKIGISQSRLSRIEAGKSAISLRELRTLEAVFGKEIEADAEEIVELARRGAGAMSSRAETQIAASELIPIVAKRWNR